MSPVRDQHVVSAALLRAWTHNGDLLAVNLQLGTARARSPRAEGFVRWFVRGDYSRALEGIWKEVEDGIPAALAAVEAGTIFSNPAAMDTIRGMLAVHIVRSKRMEAIWQSSYSQQLDGGHLAELARLLDAPEVLEALHLHQTGLHAVSPEQLEDVRRAFITELEARFGPGGTFFAEELVKHYEGVREFLRERGLEIGRSTGSELVISDNPVVTPDMATGRVDAPLGEAGSFVLPIGPAFVAAAGGASRYVDLEPQAVALLNQMQVVSAASKVYLSPQSHLLDWATTIRRSQLSVPRMEE